MPHLQRAPPGPVPGNPIKPSIEDCHGPRRRRRHGLRTPRTRCRRRRSRRRAGVGDEDWGRRRGRGRVDSGPARRQGQRGGGARRARGCSAASWFGHETFPRRGAQHVLEVSRHGQSTARVTRQPGTFFGHPRHHSDTAPQNVAGAQCNQTGALKAGEFGISHRLGLLVAPGIRDVSIFEPARRSNASHLLRVELALIRVARAGEHRA
jgi:hypothetical protein